MRKGGLSLFIWVKIHYNKSAWKGEFVLKPYDLIVVGAGPAGIFAAYEYTQLMPEAKVLVIEKGLDLDKRHCPILDKRVKACPVNGEGYAGCYPACSISSGFGGAGAYSDGKFNITSEFGGWLTLYRSEAEVMDLIHAVDAINLAHGAPNDLTDPFTPHVRAIERRGYGVGLKLLRAKVRHLGTEENIKILRNIRNTLASRVEFRFKTVVADLMVDQLQIQGVCLESGEKVLGRRVFVAPPRKCWFEGFCANTRLTHHNQVDIGVGGNNNVVMEEINETLYEGKFLFNATVGTQVRTFCSNPSGHVVIENQNGVMMVNGHAFRDPKLGSANTNFALLVSHAFSEPFRDPNRFASEIARLANQLTMGSVIVQKYGDILKGRRTTEKRLAEGFVHPTLIEAVPGDLGLVLPYNTMKSIIEMIEALNHITPGIASEHTLLYGVEAKFYSARPEINRNFETTIKGLYVGGDGAGLTRGLAQAGANGVAVARAIHEEELHHE